MKQLFLVLVFIASAVCLKAQDACYVYTYLHWAPAATKYVAKLQLNNDEEDHDILDAEGNKLAFSSMINALNYMTTQGWELVELYKKNPDNGYAKLEQYALIRKLMPVNEAAQYAQPKPQKSKKKDKD